MPSALILVADGSEEIEFSTPYDMKVLARAGVEVKTAGVDLKADYATGSRGLRFVPDHSTLPTLDTLPDALILPGGMQGALTFKGSADVRKLINRFYQEGKYVCTICAASAALVAAGDEFGWKVKVTSHPLVKEEIVKKGWDYAPDSERVVVDGKVITSRGPGTAMGWALEIAERVAGKEEVAKFKDMLMLATEL
ncbi:MAG: hypothetical protein M1814_001439 [Vezdaea aestivalis]|nr:MAG: hypothetical protein M1814_001439 [Vezdaea aestivalis]